MNNKKALIFGAIVLTAFAGGWLYAGMQPQNGVSAAEVDGAGIEVVMYQNPSCSCCGKWATYMRDAGFDVEVYKSASVNEIKRKEGIYDPEIASCHTAFVDGYIVEGHVPAQQVERLLRERPDIKGIAVPGMPVGTPGMEQGGHVDEYDVIAFTETGDTYVFASY